jgi:hypothetical protein
MDILFWTALNPDIKQLETTKVMHRYYLHRLAIRAPGASMLRHDGDLDRQIEKRNNAASYNYGGSWRRNKLSDHDIELLKFVKERIQEINNPEVPARPPLLGDPIRVRIEDPNIQFYARSELVLKNLANTLRWKDDQHFVSIMSPTNAANEKFLLDGFVLRKREIQWPFRIVFRDGRYSAETKQQLLSYLTALGDQVRVPKGLSEQLTKGGWIWGGYIYVHDPHLQSMLALIDTRLVSKVEEFKSLAQGE